MDGFRQEILPDAGLSGYQNGSFGLRHNRKQLKNFFHLRTPANNSAEAERINSSRVEIANLTQVVNRFDIG